MISNEKIRSYEQLNLSKETLLEMYETMMLARKVDERTWLLNRSGKIPFVIPCQGQEAAQVGAAFALNKQTDYILPYYRDIGVVLSFGMTAKDLLLASFGKEEDPASGGRQMPGHFSKRENRIVTGSSPVTTQVPHAVGIALAAKMKKQEFVTFTTFGEGSSNQGDFHEGLNFASVHKLPVIFMCENNKYAISVPIKKQLACEKVSDRAIGYGIPGITVNGNDPLEVYAAVKKARERALRGEGPTLIEAICYRLTPHSSDDDDRSYREREEVEQAKRNDPLVLFAEYLKKESILTEEIEERINEKIKGIVNDATTYAEHAPYAKPEDSLNYVYGEE